MRAHHGHHWGIWLVDVGAQLHDGHESSQYYNYLSPLNLGLVLPQSQSPSPCQCHQMPIKCRLLVSGALPKAMGAANKVLPVSKCIRHADAPRHDQPTNPSPQPPHHFHGSTMPGPCTDAPCWLMATAQAHKHCATTHCQHRPCRQSSYSSITR